MQSDDDWRRAQIRSLVWRTILLALAILAALACLYVVRGLGEGTVGRHSAVYSDESTGQVTGCTITDSRFTVNGIEYGSTSGLDLTLTSKQGEPTTLTNTRTKSQVASFAPDSTVTVERPGKCKGVNGITG